MAEIVLRVRLIGGEHLDVAYDADGDDSDETVLRPHLKTSNGVPET